MDLTFFTHEAIHLVVGLISFLLLRKVTNWKGLLLWVLIPTMFLDIDHLFDYFLAFGFQFNPSAIISGAYFDINELLVIPFHSVELLILLFIIGFKSHHKQSGKRLIAISFGILAHLLVDKFWYQLPLGTYFYLARALHGFSNPNYW